MSKSKKTKESFSLFPERTQQHINGDMGVNKFRVLFTDPWFIIRQESQNDYGVDVIIEALIENGKHPTNNRCHVQIKSSAKKPNKNGFYTYPVSFSNLNYLLNNPNSFYVFYSIIEDKLFYRTAENIYRNYKKTKNLVIEFSDHLDTNAMAVIHKRIIDINISIRDILLSPNKRLILNSEQFVYRTNENGKVIFLHIAIWENVFGIVPEGYEVFHKDGNVFNNRKSNLDIRKTDNPFPLEEFQDEVNTAQVNNILSVLFYGNDAPIVDDVPPPPKKAFTNIISNLINQGWSIDENRFKELQNKMKSILNMDF